MDSKTATTRYLCAVAHLDLTFRQQVLEQLVNEEHRALGPSYGVDILTLVKHCLAAQHRKTIRDIILALIFLPIIFIVAASDELVSLRSFLIITPFLVIALAIVVIERWISSFKIVRKYLSRENFSQSIMEYPRNIHLEKSLEDRLKNHDGNVIVYGGFSPFVGSGSDIGGWSFAVDIYKGKKQIEKIAEPLEFEVEELYDYLKHSLMNLSLDGISVEDKLYINGQDIRFDERFLADPFGRPCCQINPSLLRTFISNPTHTIRHYLCIRIVDWSGEFILSIYFRLSKIGRNLFIEASYFLLTPLDNYYHRLGDVNSAPSWRQWLDLLIESICTFPFVFVFSPVVVLSKVTNPIWKKHKRRHIRRLIRENLAFDYGATTSIRESSSSGVYDRYFQKLDKEMYTKIIERQLLDRIVDFLDSKGIDTSDLREQRTVVLNNGVVISGGFIRADNFSVGEGARAEIFRFARPTSSKANDTKNL